MDNKEIEFMRDAIDDLLPDTCNVLSVVSTSSGSGYVWTQGTASKNVPCRADIGGQTGVGKSWIFSLPYDQTLTTENAIEYAGIVYDVLAVNNDISWPIVKRATVEENRMLDQCTYSTYGTATNDYGEVLLAWTVAGTVSCNFEMMEGAENRRADMTVVSWDAKIRLPLSATLDVRDKVTITKHYGQLVTPISYGIAEPGVRLPSGYRYLLKRIEPSKEAE